MSIGDMPGYGTLSMRARKAIQRAEAPSVEALAEREDIEWLMLRNVGAVTILELRRWFRRLGLPEPVQCGLDLSEIPTSALLGEIERRCRR